jgi:hypothetical protein
VVWLVVLDEYDSNLRSCDVGQVLIQVPLTRQYVRRFHGFRKCNIFNVTEEVIGDAHCGHF